MSPTEIQSELKSLENWSLVNGKLYREFNFPDFLQAFAFMQAVAPVAERLGHHPEWSNVYNRVRIELITHDAAPPHGAISEKDFELAREISKIAVLHHV